MSTFPSPTFNSVTLENPVAVSGGGTGVASLTAHAVVIGEGTSAPNFAAPGATGTILASAGMASDPTFQTKSALGIAASGANTDITSVAGPFALNGSGTGTTLTISDASNSNGAIVHIVGNGSTTPGKFIQVGAGFLAILNSAETSDILNLTDSGILSLASGTNGLSAIGMVVNSIASLRTVLKTQTPYVYVTGYYSSGDGGGGQYFLATGDTTSADNGGTIIVASDGGRWKIAQSSPVTVRQFGAVGNGSTDDYTAITNALNASAAPVFTGGIVVLPLGNFRVSQGITVPSGVEFRGLGGSSSVIVGDLSIPVIVTVNEVSDTEAVPLSGILVTRAAGTIPPGSVGVSITSNNCAVAQDMMVLRSDIAYGVGVVGAGTSLGIHLLRCCSGQITGYHLQINNAVETTVTECRFGRNGGADFACQSYVNINGTQVDTVRFIACQFNQSGANATFVCYFTGYNSNANGIISFIGLHSEAWGTAILASDSSSHAIQRIKLADCTINGTGQFYAGAAATLISLIVQGNTLEGNVSFTLDQQTNSIVTGNLISGVALFNQGTQAVTGNIFQSSVTLQGASGGTVFVGNRIPGGLTNTMTGTTAIANNI